MDPVQGSQGRQSIIMGNDESTGRYFLIECGCDLFDLSCKIAFVAGLIMFAFASEWVALAGLGLSVGAGAVWLWSQPSTQEASPDPQPADQRGYRIEHTAWLSASLQNSASASMNTLKRHLYDGLTLGRIPLQDQIFLSKVSLGNSSIADIHIPPDAQTQVVLQEGSFDYPLSTDEEVHWTANFGDSNVFGYCKTGLFAQDELQVAEHPALVNVHEAFHQDPTFGRLQPGSALLIQGALRYGAIDTAKRIDRINGTLYGNNFQRASEEEIDSVTTRLEGENLRPSNIFVIAAPRIAPRLEGQPYTLQTLTEIARTAYAAFKGIVDISTPVQPSGEFDGDVPRARPRIVVHTGNWGCGAFGNDVKTQAAIVIAMARAAGIDELRGYPMSSTVAWHQAIGLLNYIERMTAPVGMTVFNPETGQLIDSIPEDTGITVGNFLQILADGAGGWGLLYRRGNGT